MALAALAFLEDLVRTIFLPVLTASSVFLTEKQPELTTALFSILSDQEAWLLVHQLLNKCAISLIPASGDLPSALQGPLTALTVPSDPAGIEASFHTASACLRDYAVSTFKKGLGTIEIEGYISFNLGTLDLIAYFLDSLEEKANPSE